MRFLNLLLLALFMTPFGIFCLYPDESWRFILSTEPLNGWPGSLFGGFVIAGFLATIGLAKSIAERLFRKR